MKIGLVLDDRLDVADGVQQYVRAVGAWLSVNGHDVRYLVGQADNSDSAIIGLSKTVGLRFNKNRVRVPLPANTQAMRLLLRKEQFDILHVQMPYAPWLAGRVMSAAPPQTAIVGTFHVVLDSSLLTHATKMLRPIYRKSAGRLSGACAVSAPAKKLMKNYLGIDAEVIPNAVELARFRTGKKRKELADGKLNVIFLGRLVERKGAEQLIRAFAAVGDPTKHHLTILGDGPLRTKLEQLCEELTVKDAVTFTGFIDESDKADYLASADVAVFPASGGESFGIVLVEAMGAKAGVVLGGNNPGYRTVLADCPEALFDPLNPTEFQNSLRKYITSKNARAQLHAKQQALVSRFDVEHVGQRLIEMYQRALQASKKVT